MPVLELPPIEPIESYPKWRFFSVSFGGYDWDYSIRWNGRTDAWYLYLRRSDQATPAINGVKLVAGWRLAARYVGRAPANGLLMLVDLGEDARDRPTFDGLGHRWRLSWVDDAEIPAAETSAPYTIGPVQVP